jgi:negative regulator of genetic competence, sporulation and motility
MREIYINTEAPCAKMSECCAANDEALRRWLGDDELYTADGRYFVKVRIAKPQDSETQRQYRLSIDMKQTYYMDCVTGTLYLEDGRCLSSNQMKPRKFVAAKLMRVAA